MKTKEELNALKEEVETLNKKLAELSEEELATVTGGKLGPVIVLETDCLLTELDTTCIRPLAKGRKEQCEGCRLNA